MQSSSCCSPAAIWHNWYAIHICFNMWILNTHIPACTTTTNTTATSITHIGYKIGLPEKEWVIQQDQCNEYMVVEENIPVDNSAGQYTGFTVVYMENDIIMQEYSQL